MWWRRIAVIALMVCGLLAGAVSPSVAQLRKGEVEAGLLVGGGVRPGGDERAQYILLRTLGFLVTDAWELGLSIGLAGDFVASPSTALLAQVQYHLAPAATVTPYVGAHGGLDADVFTSSPRIQEDIGPDLGVKWRCGEKVILITEIRYAMQASRPDHGVVLLSFGIGLLEDPDEGSHGSELPQ